MRMRVILAVVVLGLAVVTASLARQQSTVAPEHKQAERDGLAQAAPALRSQVAKLRADVELLELEHEVDRALLLEALKKQGESDSDTVRAAKAREAVGQAKTLAENSGTLTEMKKEFGDEKTWQSQVEKELKEQAESLRADNDRKKQGFVRQATELNEKRLALAELERQLADVR